MDGLSSNLFKKYTKILQIIMIKRRTLDSPPAKISVSCKFLLSYLYINIILNNSQLVKKFVRWCEKILQMPKNRTSRAITLNDDNLEPTWLTRGKNFRLEAYGSSGAAHVMSRSTWGLFHVKSCCFRTQLWKRFHFYILGEESILTLLSRFTTQTSDNPLCSASAKKWANSLTRRGKCAIIVL